MTNAIVMVVSATNPRADHEIISLVTLLRSAT
jgi:hypothetical protein